MSVATAIATAYRSAVVKPSAKLQAASQLTGAVQRACVGVTGDMQEYVCGKARGSQGAARVPRDEDGGDVWSMSLRWRRSRNARSGAEAGRTRSPGHPRFKAKFRDALWQS